MKGIMYALFVGFGAMLALVIGSTLSQDDMAVVLGVAVGVAASVPTSVLLVALVRRAQQGAKGAEESVEVSDPLRAIVVRGDDVVEAEWRRLN